MYKKNDYVVYGSMSVCQIIDIIEENNPYIKYKDYYVLQPLYTDKHAIIKVPVDNVSAFMRPILTKDEVMSLIDNINKKESVWINDDKQRNNEFKAIIKNNVTEDLAQLIRSMYLSREDKKTEGKKLSKNDEELMKSAQKLFEEELATVLNIEIDKVEDFIANHTSE